MIFVSDLPIGYARNGTRMKMVVAIIRPERLACVKQALKTSKVELVTVHRRPAHPDSRVHSRPRLRVEIFTEDTHAEEIAAAVRHAAFPNGADPTNDGRVFIVSLDRRGGFSEAVYDAMPAHA